MPAQPQAHSLVSAVCGAVSVPRKKRRIARGRRAPQSETVLLALGDRQAIEVRTDAALEDRIAVVAEMMRRDRAADAIRIRLDEGHALPGRDVLQHDLEALDGASAAAPAPCRERPPRGRRCRPRDRSPRHGPAAACRPSPWPPAPSRRGPWRSRHGPSWSWRARDRAWPPTHTPSLFAARQFGGIGTVGQIAGHQRRRTSARPEPQRGFDRDRRRPRRPWSPAAPGWA